jgi:hypothetical protein
METAWQLYPDIAQRRQSQVRLASADSGEVWSLRRYRLGPLRDAYILAAGRRGSRLMTESDGGSSNNPSRGMFSCVMCDGRGRIVRGNDGVNVRCPDCQGAGKTYTRPSRPTGGRSDKPSERPSGFPTSHPPYCDCASCTLLRTVEIPEDKSGRIRRLWRRIVDR